MLNAQIAIEKATEKGLTLQEWAKKADVSYETVRLWKNGRDIKMSTAAKLCKVLGMDWTELLWNRPKGNGKRRTA